MLALILVVEAGLTARRLDLVSPWAEGWRVSAQAAETEAPGSDVLCFGDSLIKYGVLPKVIEARTGLRAYNLATSGGTIPSAFFLLRRALDAGARPKAVVVDFAVLMDRYESRPKLLNYPDLATVRDCLDLAWASRAPGFLGSSGVSKALPSYHYRFEIRSRILASLDGRSASERASVVSHGTVWSRELGAQPTQPGRNRHPQEGLLIEGISPRAWNSEPWNRAYLERFLDLAESRGITVYWLMPPLSPEVHARRAERGSDALYDRFVREIVARHPNTVVLDTRASGYDDTVHIDYLHLDRRGASVLSADIASIMAEGLVARPSGASRWVDLPPLAGRTGDEPRSVVAQSRSSTPH
jgi:hypothetical protein